MLVFWRINYLDRTDEQPWSPERRFQHRDLHLDTATLDPTTRAAVEVLIESRTSKSEREILKFRHLFQEEMGKSLYESMVGQTERRTALLVNYVEDETGKELSNSDIGELLTGSPTAVLLPTGFQQHDVDFVLSEPKPLPVAEITLSPDDVRVFAIFSKDFRELANSAFMKDGPGTLKAAGSPKRSTINDPVLETAVTDDEIRSFVTIFRRLYMTDKEPANFLKAVAVFEHALGDHALARWVKGVGQSYDNELKSMIASPPFVEKGKCTFTRKRLIDVFLYTQYAHQPDQRRLRQFGECLAYVHGQKSILTWLFLTEMWKACLQITNAGRVIVKWFDRYCQHHGVSHDIHPSVAEFNPGIGAKEKEADRKVRLIREKAEELAIEIWKKAGSPASGPAQFINEATDQLNKALGA